MYLLVENTSEKEPQGFVTFTINERIPRVNFINSCFFLHICLTFEKIVLWINHHFLLSQEYIENGASLYVTFLCVRTDSKLIIKMQNTGQVS
jgi:hypothetical protein